VQILLSYVTSTCQNGVSDESVKKILHPVLLVSRVPCHIRV